MAILFSSDVLLTATEVQKRVKDRQEWQAQIAVLQKRVAETDEWINLVAKVIDPERASQLIGGVPLSPQARARNETTPPTVRQRPGGVTWTSFIENYVNSADRPVNYAELREAISNSILGSKQETSKKTFYGAILKLTGSGRVVKDDGWIFSVAAFDEYKRKVANGEIEPLPPSSSEQHARRPRLGDEARRLSKTRANGKGGASYHSPEASPNDNGGSEEEAAALSESSGSSVSSAESRDGEPRHSELGEDQDAFSGGPLTSTAYVGPDLAGVPIEVPPNRVVSDQVPVSGWSPESQTRRIDFGRPTPAPAPPEPSPAVKSLFEALAAARPEAPLAKSPPTKSPFQAEPAAASSDDQTQPPDLARED